MFVAHAAPATPMPKRKMNTGSSAMLSPKPITMHIIDDMGEPSARCIAESPKARCEKRHETTTMRRYSFAHANASGVVLSAPHHPSTVSALRKMSGGRMQKNASLNATSWPSSFSHDARSPSPSFIESAAECPAPTNTPNAPKSIIIGMTRVMPAIASTPQPRPMNILSTTA